MPLPTTDSVHGSLPEKTYERLRDLIVRGRIAAGTRIVEAEIALRFGVSRTPVREALARLVQERYLTPVSGGKRTEVVVAPFTRDDVKELWGIISALEGQAITEVALLPAERRQRISNDLRAINMKLAAAANARPRDPDLLFELQTAFHMRFAYETSGAHFRSIYDTIRPQVQRYEWIYGTRRDATYEPSTHEHTSIIGAIADGDADLARSALDSHWKRATARTVAVIDALVDESVKEPSRKRPARQKPITRDNRK